MHLLAVVGDGEVATINRSLLFAVDPVPTLTLNDNLVYIVFGRVQLTVHLVTAGNRDIMLAAVATHDKGYVLFHKGRLFFQ